MRFILFIVICMGLFLPAARADVVSDPLPGVGTIEAYLNGISTLRAHFTQTASDGKEAEGTFLLKRPGRMRFDYAPPVPDFIVADGLLVYYYDGKMKQQSNVPIRKSLADFFLRANLTLAGDVTVMDIRREAGFLNVLLIQTGHPDTGSLTLGFSEHPLQLRKWRVIDEQGLTTEVALSNIETGIDLSNNLFHYYDPALKETPYGRN